MRILIDDQRNSKDAHMILRDAKTAVTVIESLAETMDEDRSFITALYMDNDLGDQDIEGHHILKAILLDLLLRPRRVELWTSNPVARDRMASMLEFLGYHRVGGSPVIWEYNQ